jgi:hypothetical protein
MSDEAPDRDEEMLARLAEFDLAAAERVHGRLMAAEKTSEIAELGRTYQRIARSLRQTLALKAKLKRDREAAMADAAAKRARAPARALVRTLRARELRHAVTRVIWNEVEDPDYAIFLEEVLDDLIVEEMRRDGFCAEPLDEHVDLVCRVLGLNLDDARRWRDLPDPPEEEDADPDEPPDRMSSG